LIWAERNNNPHARLVVPLRAAKVFDLWGNMVAQAKHGRLVIALNAAPVYVLSSVPHNEWSHAWRAASLQGLRPLAAQVLPLSPLPTAGRSAGRRPHLEVRLQNISLTTFKGTISVNPPPGWSLMVNHIAIELNAGQSRVYSFKSALAPPRPNGLYAVTVHAQRGASHWQWRQNVRVAVAQHTRTVNIDGRLDDWANAAWMATTLPRPGHASRAVRLALCYDDVNLYVAARVVQSRLQVRREGESAYRFWDGNDCIELVFGPDQPSAAYPGGAGANDHGYGFLLSPFEQSGEHTEGRVLRLWGGSTPYAMSRVGDHTRWGGALRAARCFITRDEARGETLYEAELPLSQIGWLRPRRHATDQSSINFSWKVFDHSAQSSSWGRATGVFAWWAGSGSFWPNSHAYLAACTPLGFGAAMPPGRLQMPELLPLPAVPRKTPSHAAPFVRPPKTGPGADTAPPPFELPPLAPMAPSSLPAAAPVAVGTPLPPVLPATPDGG
jgi:hypothetical protein